MSSIFKNLKSLFIDYSINFEYPRKVEVLILDDNYANLKFQNSINYKIKKKNSINLIILFFTVVNFLSSKNKLNFTDLYFKNYIKSYDPKVAIGHEINGNIFRFKMLFPQKKTIIYQLANYSNFFKKTSKQMISRNNKFKLKGDYFLIKNQYAKVFFDFVDAKFIEVGSVKNNEIALKNFDKKYDIMFVSQFRSPIPSYWGTNNNVGSMRITDSATSYLIKILNKYCEEKNKKICIALSANRKDKKRNRFSKQKININDEIDFYSRDIKNFYHEDISAYELAEKSEVVITINSTLGFDLLARNKKTLFIDICYFFGSTLDPFVDSKEGFFCYQGQEPAIIKRKIDSMLQINNDDWNKVLNESKLKMKFDPNNLILKDLVSKLLKK